MLERAEGESMLQQVDIVFCILYFCNLFFVFGVWYLMVFR